MRNALNALLAVGALVLAGCSTAPKNEELPAAAKGPEIASSHDKQITGSRIPNPKTTDRVLRSIGQQEARSAMEGAPRPLQTN